MAKTELENTVSIDSIPYEILYQIVSLIPLKEAVRTIILSSSWKHLWTPLPSVLKPRFQPINNKSRNWFTDDQDHLFFLTHLRKQLPNPQSLSTQTKITSR